ncbi:MAG: hypothetical protein G01um101429_441 [Parcubacteria group bacterium Gr01-1014_29]|nr:MAG: hypothetical protein G01um101429_441 [Parcubacteria group bacterium Gr01-1014_29]
MWDDVGYSHALDMFVIVCVDAVLVNREHKTIYLARRRAKPMQGWWVVGGRMRAGEKEQDAIRRKFLQETSVDVDPARFEFLRMNRYFWKDRQQEPQENGNDSLAYTFAIELTKQELRQVSENLERNEYEASGGLREFTREELIEEGIHEAIIDLYDQIYKNE